MVKKLIFEDKKEPLSGKEALKVLVAQGINITAEIKNKLNNLTEANKEN